MNKWLSFRKEIFEVCMETLNILFCNDTCLNFNIFAKVWSYEMFSICYGSALILTLTQYHWLIIGMLRLWNGTSIFHPSLFQVRVKIEGDNEPQPTIPREEGQVPFVFVGTVESIANAKVLLEYHLAHLRVSCLL